MDQLTKDLILLNMLPDVGYIRVKTLLDIFETTEAILSAPANKLIKSPGIGLKIAESISSASLNFDIDTELSLVEKEGICVKTVFDKDYPANLKETHDPPMVLYIKGELSSSDINALAIVGSRRCTQYGIRTAKRIAKELSCCGITVVSGLARGIDTAAHKGAVSAGGRTIAVLGNGLSSIYPLENGNLAGEIIKKGALVSEFPMKMPPHKENFPRRNRIISGLSKGVVVVEAAQRSGSLITADFALEEGREVFAVPGPAGEITSKGTNNLIRQGAKITEDTDDILTELGIYADGIDIKGAVGLNTDSEVSIYNIVSDKPLDIDTITESVSLGLKEARAALLGLEMRGIVKRLPGSLYVRAK